MMAILADSFYYQELRIDTINTRVYADLLAKEGDANGRGLLVTLTENGLMKDTTGIALNLKWEHTSVGNQGLDNFDVVDLGKGLYKITYPTEMLNRGKVRAFIQIIDSGKLTGTRNIEITVDRSVGDDTAIASSDSFSALASALIEVQSWNDRIDDVEQDFINRANNLDATYPTRLVSVEQQLAQTENKVTYLEESKANNSRIDEIIVTHAEGITEQEIIDARKGKGSLRAKVDSVDNSLLENKKEIEYLYNSKPVATEWYQGSIDNVNGDIMVSDSRIRSYFIKAIPETDYFFRVSEGFEFWIVEFREQLNVTILPTSPEFHTDTKYKASPVANYIRIVIRRTGVPSPSSDPKDVIRPEDIVFTGLQVHNRSANNLIEMSEATDEMKNVNSYENIEETDNVIEMDVSNDRNFYVDIVDMVEKHVVIRGLHKVRGNMISRVLVVNSLVNSLINFPSNVDWQNDNLPSFSVGRTYMILLQSFNGGISWLGAVTSSWKNKECLVYDDFDRPDQLGLGQAPTGQVWEYSPTSVWEIRENSARVHTFRTDNDILSSDMAFCESGASNVRVSSVVEELSSQQIRLMVRVSDIHNYILVGRRMVGNAEHFAVFKMENGVQTILTGAPLRKPFVDGDTISVELDGPNIKLYHNGHVVTSVVSSFNEHATKHGIVSLKRKDNIFHNFSVEVI